MTSAGADAAVRDLVTAALRGEAVTHLQPVVRHSQVPEPPKRLRPRSRVLPDAGRRPRASGGRRALAGATAFFAWLTDPLHFLGELLLAPFRGIRWLCRGKEKRRRNKRLAGGWDSAAGSLGAAMYVHGARVIALGPRQVFLMYVGDREAEIAWSVPREEVTGVEVAAWDSSTEQRATLRWHFRDGSWYDTRAQGPGWQGLADALPRR